MKMKQDVVKLKRSRDFYSNVTSAVDLFSRVSIIQKEFYSIPEFLEEIKNCLALARQQMPSYYEGDELSEFLLDKETKTRAALALNVLVDGKYYLFHRGSTTYDFGMNHKKRVNLEKVDCLIASRVFLPNNTINKYGLFGKANKTRNKQDTFEIMSFKISFSDFSAQEYNFETGERSVMICGTMEILDCSYEFIELLEASTDVVVVSKERIEDYNNSSISTAKLCSCLSK